MYCSNCGNKVAGKYCSNCGNSAEDTSNNKTDSDKSRRIYSNKFTNKFKKVYREIDCIESKILKKEGWIFETHVYSQSELLDSDHHNKIFSITEKIGDDVQNWHINGKISDEGRNSYYKHRRKVEKKLHKINLKIENREPTFWEKVRDSLNGFVMLIMKNIPELGGWLLETTSKTIAKLPAPVGWLVGKIATNINSSYNKRKRLNYQT